MPTYEYECRKCEYKFEAFQKMSDRPLSKCPQCRGPVRRLIGTGSGIIFKGPGFYATDYRSAGYKEKEKKERGDNSQAPCSECPKVSDGECKGKST